MSAIKIEKRAYEGLKYSDKSRLVFSSWQWSPGEAQACVFLKRAGDSRELLLGTKSEWDTPEEAERFLREFVDMIRRERE